MCAATSASPAASPLTVITYFKELSLSKLRLAVPVSILPVRAGFSFFGDITIFHSFITVGTGVTGSFLQAINNMGCAMHTIINGSVVFFIIFIFLVQT